MTNYTDWNQAIVSYFTTGVYRGSKIYLSVDDDVLNQLGQSFSSTPFNGNWKDDFCNAIKRQVVKNGQIDLTSLPGRDDEGFPKGVAFLGAMVLAAYQMAEEERINQNNYFHRLKEILGLPVSEKSRPPGMNQGDKEEEPLWQEWAYWLRKNGFSPSAQRGEGPLSYINYSISQSLLRRADKQKLLQFFTEKQWKGAWDAQSLMVRVRQDLTRFSRHFQELLSDYHHKQRYEAIAEAIQMVYSQWQSDESSTATLKKTGTQTWSRHLIAGLYRTEEPFSDQINYALYPQQPRGRQIEQIQVVDDNQEIRPLSVERPGWYFPAWPVGIKELSHGATYVISDSENLEDLTLPQRDFWILVQDPENPEVAAYASWGTPKVGEKFILLCQKTLIPQLEQLKREQLIEWQEQTYPFVENTDWVEFHQCMIVSSQWDNEFIDNQALKEALQPRVYLAIHLSGGLRLSNSGVWLLGHAPLAVISSFYPNVGLKIIKLSDPLKEVFREDSQERDKPISFNDCCFEPGDYLIEASRAGETVERFVKIIDWHQLPLLSPPSTKETLNINGWQICGSIIQPLSSPEIKKEEL